MKSCYGLLLVAGIVLAATPAFGGDWGISFSYGSDSYYRACSPPSSYYYSTAPYYSYRDLYYADYAPVVTVYERAPRYTHVRRAYSSSCTPRHTVVYREAPRRACSTQVYRRGSTCATPSLSLNIRAGHRDSRAYYYRSDRDRSPSIRSYYHGGPSSRHSSRDYHHSRPSHRPHRSHR